MEVMILKRIDPSKAVPNPSTLNPGVKELANISMKALITNKNSPSVRIVAGSVSPEEAFKRLKLSA